jgi:putative DNA primase/helicase
MLAQKVTGRSFKEIAAMIEQQAGQRGEFTPAAPDQDEVRNRNAMRKVWTESKPIADISPVAKYLRARISGSFPPCDYLREHPGLFHGGDQLVHPAMTAKVISHNDTAVNLHITYLSRDGTKADVSPSKKVMPGKLPDGCAIRLMEAAPLMGVAEGIETAMSANLFFDVPVWACVNGNLLSKWLPPDIAEEIVVFADNDENYTGQAKAFHLANRLEVQHHRRVKVMVPPKAGTDWNDQYIAHIQEKRGAGQV